MDNATLGKCVCCKQNDAIMTCSLCDNRPFCNDCRKNENHEGSFICTQCNLTICNTFRSNHREEEYSTFCFGCGIKEKTKLIRIGLNALAANK